jgi:ankyrin repeat protein
VYDYVKRQGNVRIRIKGCSLLHIAAARADRDMMALLVNAGISVNVRNTAGETPLIVACRGNKDANVRALLEVLNADINARTGYGSSVLHVAAEHHSCMDVLEYLLTSYPSLVNCRDNCGRTPLTVACLAGNTDAAKRMMEMEDLRHKHYRLLQRTSARSGAVWLWGPGGTLAGSKHDSRRRTDNSGASNAAARCTASRSDCCGREAEK